MPGARAQLIRRPLVTQAYRLPGNDCEVPIKRLPDHDYSAPGAYFVTICTYRRALTFASPRVVGVVRACWKEIPSHFAVDLDVFVVMPNHVHGILMLPRAGHARPLQVVIGSFKAAAARSINVLRGSPGAPVWQRGYYERVVRSEDELEALREYVVTNPGSWNADPENPGHDVAAAIAPWL